MIAAKGYDDDDSFEDAKVNESLEDMAQGSFKFTRLNENDWQEDDDELLGYAIDSFLRGDYDRQFAEDAPAPLPSTSPSTAVEHALRSLRNMDEPESAHGAAVLMRFCAPLNRGEKWGDSTRKHTDTWKEMLRGALMPSMLANRLRASEFSPLLDWEKLDLTEGFSTELVAVGAPTVAFVNAALYFGEGTEPSLFTVKLKRVGGAWLIDSVRRSPKEWFGGS